MAYGAWERLWIGRGQTAAPARLAPRGMEASLLPAVIEQASEAILVTDTQGRIEYVNAGFEQITGYSREEVLGQYPRILKSGAHDAAFYRNMWETLIHGKTWTGHVINRKKDGTHYEETKSITPIRGAGGRITHFVSIGLDVTHERRREEQVRQSQKIEALATLASGVAHDFNNILSAILGYTELVRRRLPDDSPLQEDLGQVLNASRRARELIRQILAFSRQQEPEFAPFEIAPLVREVLQLLRSTVPAHIEIKYEADDVSRVIMGDSTQIHQVVMNLCANAFYAMRDTGGTLEIALDSVDLDESSAKALPDLGAGAYVRLKVADTGYGMDRSTLERVFEPFFTTKRAGEGTGLGLSTSLGIIKKHRGTITVYSEAGQGTIFHVYLPRAPQQSPREAVPPEPLILGAGERVLVVDDEETLARLGVKMLERLGYEAVARFNPLEALEAFRAHPERFDLVITDQSMPQRTGLELAADLRRIRPDIPIILMSGFSELLTDDRLGPAGITAVAMKPILLHDLAKTVRNALERRWPGDVSRTAGGPSLRR